MKWSQTFLWLADVNTLSMSLTLVRKQAHTVLAVDRSQIPSADEVGVRADNWVDGLQERRDMSSANMLSIPFA